MRDVLTAAAVACVVALGVTVPARAAHPAENERIVVQLNGDNEVDNAGNLGQGDPDATAVAVLENDHGALVWTVTYQNLDGQNISGFHIHGPNGEAGRNAPVLLNLIPLPAANYILPDGTLSGVVTSEHEPGLATILAGLFYNNPGIGAFYLNLHTDGAGGFPNGAVRGQLPEPGALGLLMPLCLSLLRRRRVR